MKCSAKKIKNYRMEYSKHLLQNIKELLFYYYRDFQVLTSDKPKIVEDTNAIDGPEGKLK